MRFKRGFKVFRTPSLRGRVSARLSPKRFIRHRLGLKAPRGWGWVTNPKRAAYNRLYNRSSIGCITFPLTLIAILIFPLFLIGCGSTPPQERAEALTPKKVVEPVKTSPTYTPPPEPVNASTGLNRVQMRSLGLDFAQEYPFWPLVYGSYDVYGKNNVGMSVTGTITNYGDATVSNVIVILDVYDRLKTKVDDAIDTTLSIAPGQTWKYDIPIWLNDGRSCVLREIRFRR